MDKISGNIMVVDDDTVTTKILAEYLTEAGHEVTQVNDGYRAMEILCYVPNKFNVIVLDRMMPGMSGIDMLHKLLLCSELKNIPVIMLTSHAEREDVGAAMIAGAYDFLYKPVEPDLLCLVVSRALKKYRFEQEKREASQE